MAERDIAQAIDLGTRQWNPAEHLDSVRMGLHQRLDSQRARRAAAQPATTTSLAPPSAPAQRRPIAQITLSYAELLRIVEQAAIEQRGVTLTRTTDNVYLKLEGGAGSPTASEEVGALIDLELAVRDRLEAIVARRYLELKGPDYVVADEFAPLSEDSVVERIRA